MFKYKIKPLKETNLPSGYFISNKGEVFIKVSGKSKKVKFSIKGKSYLLVVPILGGSRVYRKAVHQLVAKYFIPNSKKYIYLLHRDKNKFNNSIDNLYWNKTSYVTGTDLTIKSTPSKYNRKRPPIQTLDGEIWKKHPFLKKIEVSNFSRIKKNNFLYTFRGEPNHYRTVRLLKKYYRVHIIIAQTFLIPPSKKHIIVNHKDGNRSNNSLANLEWVTHSGNAKNRYERNPTKTHNNLEKNLNSYQHLGLTDKEFKKQKWKVIPLLDKTYYASDKGMIKRIVSNKNGSKLEYYKLAERTSTGYYECRLANGSRRNKDTFKEVRKGIHQLVAIAWLKNPLNKLTVNHKDRNKTNNRLSNLEWSTTQEQLDHYRKTIKNKK